MSQEEVVKRALWTALQAEGYAIVKLPEPAHDLWDESDTALIWSGDGTPIRVHWSGQVIYDSHFWLSPSTARADAAALLAAADKAEEGK